jgi:hypothetical protein
MLVVSDCWGQFVAMLFCQLGQARSLREICGGLASCEGKLKHLGVPQAPNKSTLAYANQHRPWLLYQKVFGVLFARCQQAAGTRHRFRFRNPLLSIDGTLIDLCVRSILGAPGTPIQAYDQDAWVAAGRYSERNPRQCLEVFRVVREANLMLLKSLKPEQWKHHGMHSERGEENIERILHMMAGHDLNHLQQIERILTPKR